MEAKAATSISVFCAEHGISRATYYNLSPSERPREMVVRSRKLISREAASDWRLAREADAARQRESA